MLIDFFTYTDATPGGNLSIDDLLDAIAESPVDGLCVIDREYSSHAEELSEAAQERGIFLAIGVEITTDTGPIVCLPNEIGDFLVDEEWRDLMTLGTPKVADVIAQVAEQGGIAIARSVYDEGNTLGDRVFVTENISAVDAITADRARVRNELSLEAAMALGVPALAGSAAFSSASKIGQVATVVPDDVESQADLIEALRAGSAYPTTIGEKAPSFAPTGGQRGGGGGRDRGDRDGRGRGRDGGRGRGGGGRGRDGGGRGRDGGRGRGRGRGRDGGGDGGGERRGRRRPRRRDGDD